jgi:hypothetical protein
MSNSQNAKRSQPGHAEHNKPKSGGQATQTHESRRTPESRADRESQLGGSNQTQARKSGK